MRDVLAGNRSTNNEQLKVLATRMSELMKGIGSKDSKKRKRLRKIQRNNVCFEATNTSDRESTNKLINRHNACSEANALTSALIQPMLQSLFPNICRVCSQTPQQIIHQTSKPRIIRTMLHNGTNQRFNKLQRNCTVHRTILSNASSHVKHSYPRQ